MENECLLNMNTETISPPSSLKDQSLNSFSHILTGRLGIVNLGTETVIHETKKLFKLSNLIFLKSPCIIIELCE